MKDKVKNKLRFLRRSTDLSQEQLGQALGVTRHTIMALENGKYEPSIALALKIAQYFNQPVENIFWFESKEEETCNVRETNV